MSHLPRIDLSAAKSAEKPRVRMKDRVFGPKELDELGAAPKATPDEIQRKLQKQQEQADRADDLFNKYVGSLWVWLLLF